MELLPKQENPEEISQFRPMCLSNVVVKVISKEIANRAKRIMNYLTGATDNIIIGQEVIHSMRRQTGRIGEIIVKIDLEKTYDKIDWNFLEEDL